MPGHPALVRFQKYSSGISARARRRGERHDVIVFTLREHWERGQKLPVELGVKPA